MKIEWKDATTYSRYAPNRTPRMFELCTDSLRIVVHRWRGIDDVWFLSCNKLSIDKLELVSTNADCAKSEAIKRVQILVDKLHKEVMSLEAE